MRTSMGGHKGVRVCNNLLSDRTVSFNAHRQHQKVVLLRSYFSSVNIIIFVVSYSGFLENMYGDISLSSCLILFTIFCPKIKLHNFVGNGTSKQKKKKKKKNFAITDTKRQPEYIAKRLAKCLAQP